MEPRHCPHCGHPVGPEDRFCRSCGGNLAESAPVEVGPEPLSEGDQTHGEGARGVLSDRRVFVPALIAIALLVAGAVVLASGVVGDDSSDGSAEARNRLEEPFQAVMDKRNEFFRTERSYLVDMGQIDEKLREYQRSDRAARAKTKRIDEEFADEFDRCVNFDVPCPEPTYPDPVKAPRLGKQTREIRDAANELDELAVQLVDLPPESELRALGAQLERAVDALKNEAEHNADVLDEAIEFGVGEDAIDQINKGKIKTLRRRSALPAIRAMNRSAVRIIGELSLPKGDYDVAGGRDIDDGDHSTEI